MNTYICRPVWISMYLSLWVLAIAVLFVTGSSWWYALAFVPAFALSVLSSPWPAPETASRVSIACSCPRHVAEDTDPENPDEAF